MYLRGEPYVPPSCPTGTEGDRDNVQIHPGNFSLVCNDPKPGEDGALLPAEVFGYFSDTSDTMPRDVIDAIDIASLDLPASDITYQHARRIRDSGLLLESAVGELFCERILICEGIKEGQCWALGEKAVRAVLSQVAEEAGL